MALAMAADKDKEKFDEIWIFAEKKMKASIPTYFKNVLNVCGYNNGMTIATMGEEDVEYIENEVKNGNVAKFFTGDKNKLFEGSGRSAENFEFTRGHKKFLLAIVQFIKKHLDENGPDCFILEDERKKKPIKTNKNPAKRLAPTFRKRKFSEVDYYVDSITAEILSTQKSQEEIEFSETIPDEDIHRKVLLKKSIMSLYCNARQIFDEKMESVRKQIFLSDFIRIKFKDLENDIQSANESTEESKVEATLEGAVRCPLCPKPITVFHKPTEINTFLWNTSNFDRHLKLKHPQQNPLETIDTAPFEKINIRANCTKPKNCTIKSEPKTILSKKTIEVVNKKLLPNIEEAETYEAESPDCGEESMDLTVAESSDCHVESIEKVKIGDNFTKPKNCTITSEPKTILSKKTIEVVNKKLLPNIEEAETYEAESPDCGEESMDLTVAESSDCHVESIEKVKIRDNFTKPKNCTKPKNYTKPTKRTITSEPKTNLSKKTMEVVNKKLLPNIKEAEKFQTWSPDCREESMEKVKIRDDVNKPKNRTVTPLRKTIVLEETMKDIIKTSLPEQAGTYKAEPRDCRVESIEKVKIRDNFTKPKNCTITSARTTIVLEETMEYTIKKPLSLAKQVETSKTESSDCREEHEKKPIKKLIPPSNVQALVSYSDTSEESEEDQFEIQAASLYHSKSKINKITPEFGKTVDSNPPLNIKVTAETLPDFDLNTCPVARQTTITNGLTCEDAFMTPENLAISNPLIFILCQRVPMLLNGYKSRHSEIVTKNTCAFDSITSIYACLYFDDLNYRAHIDSSSSKFSQLIGTFFNIHNSNTELTQSSYQKLYVDRNIILKDLYYNSWGSGKVVEKNGRIFVNCKVGIGDLFAQLCLRMHENIASAIEERSCNRCETTKGKLFPFLRISAGARDLQNIQSSINVSLADRSCTLCKSNYDMKRLYNNLLVLEVEPNKSQSQDKIALKKVSRTINVNHKDYELCGVIQYHGILEHFTALVRRVNNKWKSYDDIKYCEMDIEDSIEINPFLLFYISINNHNDFMTSFLSFLSENKSRQAGMPLIRKISRCDALLSETRHQQLENDQKSNPKRRQLEYSLGNNRKEKQSRLASMRTDPKNDDKKDLEDRWNKYF